MERPSDRTDHVPGAGTVSTASNDTANAPDEPVGAFDTGNDPTGGERWVRRILRVRDTPGGSLNAARDLVLMLPGVARAAVEPHACAIVIDMEPAVLSDDELVAALEREGVEAVGWDDRSVRVL